MQKRGGGEDLTETAKVEVCLRVMYIASIVTIVYIEPSGHHSWSESNGCNDVTVGI